MKLNHLTKSLDFVPDQIFLPTCLRGTYQRLRTSTVYFTCFSLSNKMRTPFSCKTLLLISTTASTLTLLLLLPQHAPPDLPVSKSSFPTHRRHLLFSIASSARSLHARRHYISLWYSPLTTRAFVFLDKLPADQQNFTELPPVIVSGDTSGIPYTYQKGLRSAIRVARVVKEAVEMNLSDVRWFVFGDDDTVFFVDNLVTVLSKYNHEKLCYIGGVSEIHEQNDKYSFGMAFGGGGFVISYSLGVALAKVLDSCLVRYADLYGSDSRVHACVAELGVGLTLQPGFHQVDVRGNLLGILTAHPMAPLVSLHHLDNVDPIFPNKNKAQALGNLFTAFHADPIRILQQTVCYDKSNTLTISISWGYAIQVYEGDLRLPDLLKVQKTFLPWTRNKNLNVTHYMFNTREYPKHPCRQSAIFFFHRVVPDKSGVWTDYKRYAVRSCTDKLKHLKSIRVFSERLEGSIEKLEYPRRHCCDVHPFFAESMVINLRHCGGNELISMHSH